MLQPTQLLLSAVKNGQSDIFVYDYDKNEIEQITNDSYADLDATFVTFPNKSGIIFSSNRPNPNIKGGDTGVPLVVAEPASEAARAFLTVAERTAAQVSIAVHKSAEANKGKIPLIPVR